MGTKQKCRISRHILDAGCYYEEGAFTLSFLPRRLPELFTARFTPSVDFTEGDVFIIKGRRFTVKTRTMEEPAGKLFSAGAVVQCDIDMERNLAFVTTGGEAQAGGVNLGSAMPEMNGIASAGLSTSVSREDHIHPSDTSRAPIDSPALTGEPTAPTPTSTSPATAIATKEYVDDRGNIPNWGDAGVFIASPGPSDTRFPSTLIQPRTNILGDPMLIPATGYLHCPNLTFLYPDGLNFSGAIFINGSNVMTSSGSVDLEAGSRFVSLHCMIPVAQGDILQIRVSNGSYTTAGAATWLLNRRIVVIPFR